MKFFPVNNPFSGERLSTVDPEPATFPEKDWRRRLKHFKGRALTHTAFIAEQTWRNSHIAALGQLLSPGVVMGLMADKEVFQAETDTTIELIHVSAGFAVSSTGEVITITRPISAALRDIFVYEHDIHVERRENTVEQLEYAEQLPTFGELIDDEGRLTAAAILVLQPVYAEINVQADNQDPCELDPENFAYENWQLMDACRLVLYTWPDNWIPSVPRADQWRNRLAYAIFDKERELEPLQIHPWETLGVPIALIGFDNQWNSVFVDRHAVVRAGGKQRRTSSILPDIGNRYLWQAQFQQFNEHLAEIVAGKEISTDEANNNISDTNKDQLIENAEAAFNLLPPMGVLPKYFMDPRGGTQTFFSVHYAVEAQAIPYEQLDVAIRDSASLAPFDIDTADRVQVLVPVPQIYFEPELLKTAEVAQEFDDTIRRFINTRDMWLGKRLDVRRKTSAIYNGIKAEFITYLSTDPDAVDELELNAPFETSIIEVGDSWRYFKGTQEPPEDWMGSTFDDTAWLSGVTGIGYGDTRNETTIDDMEGFYVSLYLRKTFTLEEVNDNTQYKLQVATNGGFYVYLNGQEIESENVFNRVYNAPAKALRRPVFQTFDISQFRDSLVEGTNVLAIQVHNYDIDHPSFTFIPRLTSKQFVSDVNEEDYGTQVSVVSDEGTGDDSSPGGQPQLDENYEPIYTVTKLEELKTSLLASTPVRQTDINQLDTLGLERFIEHLEESIKKANLNIDFGYLKLRTDIYRIRQFVLGNVEATKLATSPVLAGFAQGETATATKKDLADFMERLKETAGQSIVANNPNDSNPGNPPPVRAGSATISGVPAPREAVAEFGGGGIAGGTPTAGVTTPFTGAASSDLFTIGAADLKLTKEATLAQTKGTSALFAPSKMEVVDVEEQAPIVGLVPEFHNATVGERLKEPIASNAKSGGIATKAEVIKGFLDTDINLEGIDVPGFRNTAGAEETKKFEDLTGADVAAILQGTHDVNPRNSAGNILEDESAFFNAGVRALENAGGVLLGVEGRVHEYKNAIQKCKDTLKNLKEDLSKADQRLKVINNELAEARHDVTVSRALKDEEQTRVDALNARRDEIIKDHVPFLVYRRPRVTEARINTPVHTLNPDLSEAPLPVCTADDAETPEQISAMMDILRDAPLKWFSISKKILDRLNRIGDLRVTMKGAVKRAKTITTKHPYLEIQYNTLDRLNQSMAKALFASHQLVASQRDKIANFDLSIVNQIGWNETAAKANDVISLGDVIDGNHGRFDASREASQALAEISRTATCLYIRFGQVLPSIRLDWAERLSQFDSPMNLRNLYSLPRWNEIDYIERKEMQVLVDSLFQRILVTEPNMVKLMNDLIRICILLASHAPVNKIIAGHIPEPAVIQVGTQINIITDLSRVRVGMEVLMQSGSKTVAKAKVEDIVAGQIKARVKQTKEKTVSLEKGAKVQIAEPRTFGSVPVTDGQMLSGAPFLKGTFWGI